MVSGDGAHRAHGESWWELREKFDRLRDGAARLREVEQ